MILLSPARGCPKLDLKTRDLASAIQLDIVKGPKNARPKKSVRDELLIPLEKERGTIQHKGIKFELLHKKRKDGMTDGKDPQIGRMRKVICRSCKPKPGTKGHILRQSEGSILAYEIATCREHGDMIVELRKKDQPVAEGVPFYVVDAEGAGEGESPAAAPERGTRRCEASGERQQRRSEGR